MPARRLFPLSRREAFRPRKCVDEPRTVCIQFWLRRSFGRRRGGRRLQPVSENICDPERGRTGLQRLKQAGKGEQ